VAQFFIDYGELAIEWDNQFIVCLAVRDESSLWAICNQLDSFNISYSKFFEPDLDNQLTSISFIQTEQTEKITKKLKLLN
jgi:hypothetical protein